jgi:acylphosphatase
MVAGLLTGQFDTGNRKLETQNSKNKRLHAVVQGRVQGVGFRYFAVERARDLRLVGFCRNLSNGDVEVVAEGEEGALEALMVALRQGPQMAHVEKVHAVQLPATGEFASFRAGSSR